MDAISYLRILGGRWKIVALTALIGLVAGWITTPGAGGGPATGFSATHILRAQPDSAQVQEQGSRGGPAGPGSSNVGVTALLATTGEVPIRAAAELDTEVPALLQQVRATSDPVLGTLSITAVDADPTRAAEIADTFAAELLEVLTEQAEERYTAELEQATALRAALQAQLDDLPGITAGSRQDVESAERAAVLQRFTSADQRVQELEAQGPPSAGFVTLQSAVPQPGVSGGPSGQATGRQPESDRRGGAGQSGEATVPALSGPDVDTAPDRTTRMLIGGAVGLLLGIGLALLRERLDARIRTREDAERAFGLPVLAEVPHLDRDQRRVPQIATVDNGRALEAESYRVLATSLLFQRSSAAGAHGWVSHNGHRQGDGLSPDGVSSRAFSTDLEPPELVDSADDVLRATNGLALLGRLPSPPAASDRTGSGFSASLQATSPAGDAYRALRSHFVGAGSDGPARTLLVTSATAREATTAMAADLGVALSGDGLRVAVVDGNLRQPRLHALFDLANNVGFTSVVSGEVSLSAASQAVTGRQGLSIVAAGPIRGAPEEFLTTPRTEEVLAALAGTVDVVILTAPPVLASGDASAVAERVDGTVLVATAGSTSGPHLRGAVDMLQRAGASLLGVVLHEPHGGRPNGQKKGGSAFPPPSPEGDVILVTSPGAKEGKTSASTNLAVALAEAGNSVLALDFDLRRPRLHEFFEADAHQSGLSDVLAHSGRAPTLEEVVRPTMIPQVQVALSGSAVTNPSELLPGARQVVARARRLAQVVVIDTPPVLVASDAVQLIPAADAVVIACRTGTTRVAEAARARQLLSRMEAPVLGLVLLGVQPSSGARSYYYDHSRRPFWARGRLGRHQARRRSASDRSSASAGAPAARSDGATKDRDATVWAKAPGPPQRGAQKPTQQGQRKKNKAKQRS